MICSKLPVTHLVCLALAGVLLCGCAMAASRTADCTAIARDADSVEVLVIVPDRWGANTFFNLDDYSRMGWHFTFAGLTEDVLPCPWFDSKSDVDPIHVDLLIPDITDITEYDAVAIMSSKQVYIPDPYADLMGSPETLNLISTAVAHEIPVWATCAGVRVLAAADVLYGRKVVGKARFQSEYEAAGATFLGEDHPAVIDWPVITSVRGMYYHHHNNQAIAMAIEQHAFARRNLPGTAQAASSVTHLDWPDVEWAHAIGTTASDGARDIIGTADGGFVLTGFTWAAGNPDLVLAKIDSEGELVWWKTFGGTGWEFGNSVCLSPDGGVLAAGYTSSTDTGQRDVFLVRTDGQGAEIWQKTFGCEDLDVAESVCSVPGGGFAVCGATECGSAGEDDIFVLRIDAAGTEIWRKTFGGERTEMGLDIHCTSDGGFIVGASCGTSPPSAGNQDYYLIRLNSDGDSVWENTFGNDTGEGFDFLYACIPTSDGGYMATGSSDATFPLDCVQIKTDTGGQFEWESYTGCTFYDYGLDLCELRDGYMMCGVTKPVDTWDNNILAVRMDGQGGTVRSWSVGGSGTDWADAVCRSSDSGVLIAGMTESGGAGNWDMVVVKLGIPGNGDPQTALRMPADFFHPGDTFYLSTRFWNPNVTATPDMPLFVILEVAGIYYFWPGWTVQADYRVMDLDPGASACSIIPEFAWPAGTGSASGIGLYAAFTTPDLTALWGGYDFTTFGWSE